MAENKPNKASNDAAAGDAAAVAAGRSLTGRSDPPASASSAAAQQHQQHNRHRSGSSRIALLPTPAPVPAVRKPQPAVYWNDKKSMEQQRQSPGPQRTFFDESTPPPSPSYLPGSSHSLSTGYPSAKVSAAASAAKDGGYDYRYDHVAPPASIPPRSKFGNKRRMIWMIVGVAAVVILALAIGLGVGLSRDKGSSDGGSDKDGASSSSASSGTSSSVPSGTSSSPKETSTTSTHTSTVCPAANNTVFEVPNSSMTFLRLCGVDYSGDGAAEDLATVWTASVQDCIINCAGYDGCTACSWGAIPGDNYRDNHRCFLKKNLVESKQSKVRAGWDFAIMQ